MQRKWQPRKDNDHISVKESCLARLPILISFEKNKTVGHTFLPWIADGLVVLAKAVFCSHRTIKYHRSLVNLSQETLRKMLHPSKTCSK